MQKPIDFVGGGNRRRHPIGIGFRPDVSEQDVAGVLALGAGPVAGRQRGRLIQEEQLRVSTRCHDRPITPSELQDTDEPTLASKWPPDSLVFVVQTAAVAHQGATALGCDQLPKRRHAILSRQRIPPCGTSNSTAIRHESSFVPLVKLGAGDLLALHHRAYNTSMTTISIHEIQRDPLGCLRRVEAGETLVVVRGERPIAEIKPVPSPTCQPRPFGLCAGQFAAPDDFDRPLPDDCSASLGPILWSLFANEQPIDSLPGDDLPVDRPYPS
jgi:antitoxin (DNA-binding transcriptional repressor) of toxin-antitoxin stability system